MDQATFADPAEEQVRDEPLVVHRHSGLTENENLVVFVHGLGGRRYGARSTWGRFPSLLFEDLPKVDVGLYSYVSFLGRARFRQSISLEDEAEILAGILVQASTYKRVVLIGHSMGGLLCKAVVKHLVESGEFPHPPRVSGLILLATPQAGSLRVPWLARRVSRDGQALAAHGALVTRLNIFFTTHLVVDGSTPPPGREALPTWAVLGASDFWVDALSAGLGLPMNRMRRVRGSHTTIVKPPTRDADAFRFVADCVRRAVETDGAATAPPSAELPARDAVPSVGTFLDRVQLRAELESFLTTPQQRSFLLTGPPGWGKRYLAAKVVDDSRKSFDDALWLDCAETRGTASFFLGQLHDMLSQHGDPALEGLWHTVKDDGVSEPLKQLVAALSRKRYLIVLHGVERWLDSDGRVRDRALRTTLLHIMGTVNEAKLLVTSDVRPSFDPSGLELPIGALVERTIAGLDEGGAVDLLRAAGLRTSDDQLLRRIAGQYAFMPAALRIFAELVNRTHRDPEEILSSTEVESAVDGLLMNSLADLPTEARTALDQLAVFRRPVSRAGLQRLGGDVGRFIPLLAQRLLVEVDTERKTVLVAAAVRGTILRTLDNETRARLHRAAADHLTLSPRPAQPADLAEAEAALEESFHRLEADDVAAAADALGWAGGAMLRWGYIDAVSSEADRIWAAADRPAAQAQAAFLLGEIADLRGLYDEAAAHFLASRRFGTEAELWPLVTSSTYRLGRIAASRGRGDEAEGHFNDCMALCGQHGVGAGWAGALLGLGWLERQRGGPADLVRQWFGEALSRARETGDTQIEASAHRELGYLVWTVDGDQAECRKHFEEARRISEQANEVKELGAVHTTLGYLETEWGDTRAAIDDSWTAVHISKAIGDNHMLGSAYDHLGRAWEKRGDLGGAESWYRRSWEKELQIDNPSGQVIAQVNLSRVQRKQGRVDQAAKDVERARRLATSYGIAELLPRVEAEERALAEELGS